MSQSQILLTNPVQWTSTYRVGCPLIDNQHKRLFRLIEDLRLSFFHQKADNVIHKTLQGLVAYCAEHFECEEMFMQAMKFPQLKSHTVLHRQFAEQTMTFFRQMQEDTLVPEQLLSALLTWLVEHVMGADMLYVEHCNKKGLDMSSVVTVSDLRPFIEDTKVIASCNFPLEVSLSLIMLPSLALFCWLAFWQSNTVGQAISGAGVFVIVVLDVFLILFVKSFIYSQAQPLLVSQTKRLSEDVTASELASKIAIMRLDRASEFFPEEEGILQSSLLRSLKEIVTNLQNYLPYIPETVLAMVREDEEEDGELSTVPSMASVLSNNINMQVRCDPVNVARSAMRTTDKTRASIDRPSIHVSISGGGAVARFSTEKAVIESGSRAGEELVVKAGSPLKRLSVVASMFSTPKMYEGLNLDVVSRHKSISPLYRTIDMLKCSLLKKSFSLLSIRIFEFEKITRTIPAVALLALHEKYVCTIQETCKLNRGVCYYMLGDHIMLSWNAANGVGNHAEMACSTALSLRVLMAEDEKLRDHKVHYAVATGAGHVGNMGCATRRSFCILGPIPAIAHALSELNSFLHTDILICSQTWLDVKETYLAKMVTVLDIENATDYLQTPVASNAPPMKKNAGLLFALELKKSLTARDNDHDWMYTPPTQDQDDDPYASYHEAIHYALHDDLPQAIKILEEFLNKHANDDHILHILEACKSAEQKKAGFPIVKWKFGWTQVAE